MNVEGLRRFLLWGALCVWAALSACVAYAGVPEASQAVCAYCGTRLPDGIHSSNCPYSASPADAGGGGAGSVLSPKPKQPDMNSVIQGMFIMGVLDAVLNPPARHHENSDAVLSAERQAEALRAQQATRAKAADSASFRLLQAQAAGYKGGSTGALGLKGVDDDLTAMAASAREPFDTAGEATGTSDDGQAEPSIPTPFFGDTMSEADLRTLVEPENDPRVVDLREAQTYVVSSLKMEQDEKQAPPETLAKPERTASECVALQKKLEGFLTQREKFAKTVDLASTEMESWQARNREALLNAAKAGVEQYLGNLLGYLSRRGAAADRLLGIYAKNATTMARDGVDVAALSEKMHALKRVSAAGQLATLTSQGQDWAGFMKDGLSALISGLSSDNAALEATLADPKVQKYFESEMPGLKAAMDLTRIAAGYEVFGKWAARKMPVIAGCELAVNQLYNATDWALSFKRVIDSHQIYGNVLAAAKGIQQHITETRTALGDCRGLTSL